MLACERCLVLQEGFATEELFASIPRASFNLDYLIGVGVAGLGLQTFLLNLHKELHVSDTLTAQSSSALRVAAHQTTYSALANAVDASEQVRLLAEIATANKLKRKIGQEN